MEQLFQQLVEEGLDVGHSDDEDDQDEDGHPDHSPNEVIENLRKGYKYHKNGPAREYSWSKSEIAEMTKMIERKNNLVKLKQAKERIIRGQDYRGNSEKDHLLRWVNSCRMGYRFPLNPKVERGPQLRRVDWSNKKLWEYVSRTLIAEFDYWTEIFQSDQAKAANIQYPKVSDLIFRHNEDFTSGLWSEFAHHWERFIDNMRYIPVIISLLNFILVMSRIPSINKKCWRA